MSDPTETYIENLIERLENERKLVDELFDEIEQFYKRIEKGESVKDDYFKLARHFNAKLNEKNRTEDETLELYLNNNVIKIKSPKLRQRLRILQREIRELYKKKPYERWLSEGFLSDDEWKYWINEIECNIHDRPWSDLLYQIVSIVDPNKYGDRGLELTALILTENIPQQFHHLLKEVELSYRFGLFNMVLICCRSILEIGIKKYYEDTDDGEYKSAKQNEEVNLENLIDGLKGKGIFKNMEINKAHFVRRKANSILHSGKIVTQQEAFSGIKNTHFVIKRLFGNDHMTK